MLCFFVLLCLLCILCIPALPAEAVSKTLGILIPHWSIQILAVLSVLFLIVYLRNQNDRRKIRIFFKRNSARNRISINGQDNKSTVSPLKFFLSMILFLFLLFNPVNTSGFTMSGNDSENGKQPYSFYNN